MTFSDSVDRAYEREITEAGVTIQVNQHTSAVLDPVTLGWSARYFKTLPNGRTYELINRRWHRVEETENRPC